MIERIVDISIRRRGLVVLLTATAALFGVRAALNLPVDAVPDITTNQVQVNSLAPGFAAEEMERYVTFPIEVALSSVPRKMDMRSISQFGLSQVTVTFEEDVDLYWARQLVLERLLVVRDGLPPGVQPELAPISTGLGEVYQFTLEADSSVATDVTSMELRSLLDWVIKPQLRTLPGVIEVNSYGGQQKQYEVQLDPERLRAHELTIDQVLEALARNNANAGGAYLEEGGERRLLRGVGLIESLQDVENTVVASRDGRPVLVRHLGQVGFGAQIRQGAATRDGRGETVMGIAMMLKGANSRDVARRVETRLQELQAAMPDGVDIRPYYDRSDLVGRTIGTASGNLVKGGILVVGVLFLFLLQLRAGLIVSAAIPLSMLTALAGMAWFDVSANLMSLGAIDFGLIVDGAVIIVESCVRRLALRREELGRELTEQERVDIVRDATVEIYRPALFGMLIIMCAYVPVLALSGIEGKMFRPMAAAVLLALAGALVLSLTLTPALCALFLRPSARGENHGPYAAVRQRYQRLLLSVLERPRAAAIGALLLVGTCIGLFPLLGSEFLPDLDEGAVAVNHARMKSISLDQSIRQTTLVERELRALPEVETVVSRIGRPEIATDPMGVELVDTYAFLKPAQQWRPGVTKEDLVAEMDARLDAFPGVVASFSQPIKFRMMELIEGVGARADVVVKIYGDDMDQLLAAGARIGEILTDVEGGRDVQVQRVSGLPMLEVRVDREAAARYGVDVADVLQVVQTAIAGTQATTVLEGFRRFDLVVRLPEWARANAATVGDLLVTAPEGERVPLRLLARIEPVEGPAEISRDNGQRRLAVEANVRGRDIGSFVDEARARVDAELDLPAGYLVDWGGTFEHLESGRERLLVVVPITFGFILVLLVTALRSVPQALLVFTGIPFAISGGVLALLVRDMPFSMSAGVGFVAVSGVAVLNGVVLVTYINQLRELGHGVREATLEGAMARLRPVLLTALVASLGFVPMALSTATGAEVQKPLATVVIGGIVTDTVLTLLVLPALYRQAARPPTSRGSRHRSGWA